MNKGSGQSASQKRDSKSFLENGRNGCDRSKTYVIMKDLEKNIERKGGMMK
jgi:hypothetical protein